MEELNDKVDRLMAGSLKDRLTVTQSEIILRALEYYGDHNKEVDDYVGDSSYSPDYREIARTFSKWDLVHSSVKKWVKVEPE